MNGDLGPFGWDFQDEKFRGLSVGTKVVCTKSIYIGHVGRVVSLHSDGRVTYIFPTFSSINVTYSAEESKSWWGIAVIPPDSSVTKRLLAQETKYYKLRNIKMTQTHKARNDRANVLLTFL